MSLIRSLLLPEGKIKEKQFKLYIKMFYNHAYVNSKNIFKIVLPLKNFTSFTMKIERKADMTWKRIFSITALDCFVKNNKS